MRKLPKKETPKKSLRLNLLQRLILFIGLFILIISTLPILVVVFVGLLPTLTIMLTDSKNTYKVTIVGCFNLAGILICSSSLLNQFDFEQAFSIIGNVFNLIVMLSSAALGVILYYEMPNLFVFISKLTQQKRLKYIDYRLEKLSAEWGNSIRN